MNTQKEDGYLPNLINHKLFGSLPFCCVIVILMWGLVPALAKSADFSAGFTTFWVNVFSTVGVLIFMFLLGTWKEVRELKRANGLRYAGVSVVWPLAYSLAFFSVIDMDTGSLATLLNYMWPLFALVLLWRSGKMRVPAAGAAAAVLAFFGVVITFLLEGEVKVLLPAVAVGIFAPITQAYFNVETDDEKRYPHLWLLTLIGALVTVVGSAIFILVAENGRFFDVELLDLLPLAIIGIGGNSLGFFAFVKASQLSSRSTEAKITYLLSMFLVPFAQLLALLTGGVEDISGYRWIGVAIVAVSLLGFKSWEHVTKKRMELASVSE